MSKSSKKDDGKVSPDNVGAGEAVAAGDVKSPVDSGSGTKRTRRPSVKYDNIIRSEYVPPKEGETLKPLDRKCEIVKGKVVIPGVVCKLVFGEPVISVPETGTVLREPTLRQLVNYLITLDK